MITFLQQLASVGNNVAITIVAGQSMKVGLCCCIGISMCINTSDTVSNSPYSSLANCCLFCTCHCLLFYSSKLSMLQMSWLLVYIVHKTGRMSAWVVTSLRALIACMCMHWGTVPPNAGYTGNMIINNLLLIATVHGWAHSLCVHLCVDCRLCMYCIILMEKCSSSPTASSFLDLFSFSCRSCQICTPSDSSMPCPTFAP